jgi:hypothetical protein
MGIVADFRWRLIKSDTTLGWTQPVTEMRSKKSFLECKARLAQEDDNFASICVSTIQKILEPRHLIIIL